LIIQLCEEMIIDCWKYDSQRIRKNEIYTVETASWIHGVEIRAFGPSIYYYYWRFRLGETRVDPGNQVLKVAEHWRRLANTIDRSVRRRRCDLLVATITVAT